MEQSSILPDPQINQVGFGWWKAWAWLGLTIGNLYVLGTVGATGGGAGLAWIFVAINSIFCIFILKMNKYAFLWATILSLNPLIWIINGVYLKKRWNHPLVNKKNSSADGFIL